MTEPRSLLLVPVRAAEEAVSPWRATWPAESQGLPGHITLLGPFLPPDRIDDAVRERLGVIFAHVKPIDFRLQTVRAFESAVYLAPDPATPFAELTALLWREWPQCPPYGERFDEPVPHLTVAVPGETDILEVVAAALGERLPLRARGERAELWIQDDTGVWRPADSFLFAGGRPPV